MSEGLPPLESQDTQIIISKLRQYGSAGKLSDLQTILGFLKHRDERVKTAAAKAAAALIKENLISRYDELEKEVREKLGQLLHSLDPRIVDEISKDLYCESEERRLRAIQILGLLKDNPRIREVLVNLVKDRNEKVRATAVVLLGKVLGPNDQDLILSILSDPDKRVRANTIEALESLGNKRLIPILLRFRKDGNNRIRGNILKALYNLGYTDIEADLLEMIGSRNEFMKASALWVVSQIDLSSAKIEDAAGRAFLSENEMVIRNAKKALSKLSTPRSLGYLRYLDLEAVRKEAGTGEQ